jgi:hypothetical protein
MVFLGGLMDGGMCKAVKRKRVGKKMKKERERERAKKRKKNRER